MSTLLRLTLTLLCMQLAFVSDALGEPAVVSVRPEFSREAWKEWRRSGREWPPQATASLYEKFELAITLTAEFNNPYDPEQVDLWAEFTAPSGKVWKIWGFYQPNHRQQWCVRFSPTEVGSWSYVVKVRDKTGEAAGQAASFDVPESQHKGFVSIAKNGRYLQNSDGSSFYGVGMWFNDAYEQRGQGEITEQRLDRLEDLGVNFISFFHSPLETVGTGLGRYDQGRADRLDQVFRMCEERDIRISWNLVFHSYISEEVWGEGNAWYGWNPYRNVAEAKDWFTSEEAWRYQQKLYRYIIARWGYSRSLFLWFIVDEINGTEGWLEGGTDGAEAWCRKMNEFFHKHDPYGRPTTGTQSGGGNNWWPNGYEIFDIAGREIYEAQGHPFPARGKPDLINDNPLRYSYLNYSTQVQKLRSGFNKPAIIAECGWDHTYYEPGMPGYLAMYHNALWASLANGTCATPFWWSHHRSINDSILNGQLRAFSRFAQSIDFANSDWKPTKSTTTEGDAWCMSNGSSAFGWFANPKSNVARETITVHEMPTGTYNLRLYRTWPGRYLGVEQVVSTNGKLDIKVPELVAEEGHGQYIGEDIAFKLERADQ